jgi:hypothetical protein
MKKKQVAKKMHYDIKTKGGHTYSIYNPRVAANPTDKYKAEIRHKGWAKDESLFDSEKEAHHWAKHHTGKMSKGVAKQYIDMAHRWENK